MAVEAALTVEAAIRFTGSAVEAAARLFIRLITSTIEEATGLLK